VGCDPAKGYPASAATRLSAVHLYKCERASYIAASRNCPAIICLFLLQGVVKRLEKVQERYESLVDPLKIHKKREVPHQKVAISNPARGRHVSPLRKRPRRSCW